MRSYSTMINLLYIITVSYAVSGHPFRFLPQHAIEEAAERRSIGTHMVEQTNFLNPLSEYGTRSAKSEEPWTEIGLDPVSGIQTNAGSRVELECKASGSPPPEIFWFTGSENREELLKYVKTSTHHLYYPFEEWKGMARTNSKLVIDCATPGDTGLIYCASVSAREVKISTPTLLLVNDEGGKGNCSSESEPTITLFSPTVMTDIGSTVVLPCKATGKPTPQITWKDNFGLPVKTSSNLRQYVLDNGNLLIEKLAWEDMGDYTCEVKSGNFRQSVSTFLYPLSPAKDRSVKHE